jgi:hypothetical protein
MSTNAELYEQDFYAWTQATAALVQAGKWHEIDPGCLTEELSDLGSNITHAVHSHLYQLLRHLLKWQYQPRRRVDSHSWQDTIEEARDQIPRYLERSPSLQPQLPTILAQEYSKARRRASRDTHLPLSTFPATCPWTAEQVLDTDFWPEADTPSA